MTILELLSHVLESLNNQKTNYAEEDEFLDTHIDHTILKGCGKLQQEATRKEFRRKEEELRLDNLVPETSTHLHHHIKKLAQSDQKQKNESQKVLASLNKNLPLYNLS